MEVDPATTAGVAVEASDALHQRWVDLFGHPAPALGKRLLAGAIGHRLQEKALGGLKPTARRALAQAAGNIAAGEAASAAPSLPKPGTRFIRQWQGQVHEVTVLEDGVAYGGQRYRSLSQVARAITGVRWSGPRFFGLKGNGANDAASQA